MKSVKLNIIIYIFNLIILMSEEPLYYRSSNKSVLSEIDVSSSAIYEIIFKDENNDVISYNPYTVNNGSILFDGSKNGIATYLDSNQDYIFNFTLSNINSIKHIEIYTSYDGSMARPEFRRQNQNITDPSFSLDLNNITIYYQSSDIIPLIGTWKINYLHIGPSKGEKEDHIYENNNSENNDKWWEYYVPGDRPYYEDDLYIFKKENGELKFNNIFNGITRVETWQQEVESDGPGVPIAPHDGFGNATWDVENNILTLSGEGAFIGLAKVANGYELTHPDDAPSTISYEIYEKTNNGIKLDINNGSGWWRFALLKYFIVNNLYFDDFKPGFFFIEVEMPLSDAQTITSIAFEYEPSIFYTVDSVQQHFNSNKQDEVIFKLILKNNVSNDYNQIIGFSIITSTEPVIEPEPAPASAAHIGTRGNKIGNDSSGNLIIKTISGNFLEMSCNEVKIDKDLNVYGNVDICGVLKINDININGDLKIIDLDICGVLKINDYSFPESSNGYGDKVLKLNTDATQLEWSDTHSDISENILQVRGNIIFDKILLKEDELLNVQSVHTLENGFLYDKIKALETKIDQLIIFYNLSE